jgi:ABC-2 type transport system ATP-binding protein/sodium transport system ATP-binding protein
MIVVNELVKRFNSNGREIVAVDGVSFQVGSGEVFGLLGPNGAGKTTTLRMVVGLLRPDAGYAEIGGYRTLNCPDQVKARIGLVSASAGVYPWLSVREMLLFFADLYGLGVEQAKANLERLADILDMHSYLDRRCLTLSTGQTQRVTLARALIHDPPVMLLDEPTRGLDVIASQVVFDYIDHLREEGKAIIVSTHRLDEAERLCDRFGLLLDGKILHQGSMDELVSATGQNSLIEMFLSFVQTGLGKPLRRENGVNDES